MAVFWATSVTGLHLQGLCMQTPPAGPPMLQWYAASIGLTVLWAGLVATMPRAVGDVDAPGQARLFWGLVAVAAVLHAAAALTPPAMSIDPLSYFCHGILGLKEPGGAYLHRVATLDQTPYSASLRALGWLPWHGISPYGPLWTHIEVWIVGLFPDVLAARRAFQVLAMLCNALSAFGLYQVAAVLGPHLKKAAVLGFLFNPIILFELSGEGHNDAAMLACIIAALALTLRCRFGMASVCLAAGAGVKYVPVLFAIPQWLYFRTALGVSPRRWLLRGILSAALCALFLVVCFCGVFVGPDTFAGIADVSTPVTLSSVFNQIWWRLHDRHWDSPPLVTALSWGMRLAFMAGIQSTWRRAHQSGQAVAAAFFATAFFYAVVASPTFWIWYLATPCALLVAQSHKRALFAALMIGTAGRLASPLDDLIRGGAIGQAPATLLTTVVACVLPLLYVLVFKPHHWPEAAGHTDAQA